MTSENKNQERKCPKFSPPVFRQRYLSVAELVSKYGNGSFSKVVDMGCASLGLFNYLKNVRGIKEIVCMDNDFSLLMKHHKKIDQLASECLYKRKTPLTVSLLCADARYLHASLKDTDVVLMIEFIEHLEEDDLRNVLCCVFSGIQPKLIIVTTPNRDFNRHFPKLHGGQFRHLDHKFEFTHSEFIDWCQMVISAYPNYQVSYTGCGYFDKEFCTQTAVFVRNKVFRKTLDKHKGPEPDDRYSMQCQDIRPCHVNCTEEKYCRIIYKAKHLYDDRSKNQRQIDSIKRSWTNLYYCLKRRFETWSESLDGHFLDATSDCTQSFEGSLNTTSDTWSLKESLSDLSLDPTYDTLSLKDNSLNETSEDLNSSKNNLFTICVYKSPPKSKSKRNKKKSQNEAKTLDEKNMIFVKIISDMENLSEEMTFHQDNTLYLHNSKERFYVSIATFVIWAGLEVKQCTIEKTLKDMKVKKIEVQNKTLYVVCVTKEAEEETDASEGRD